MEQRILTKACCLYILGLLIAWYISVPAWICLIFTLVFLGSGFLFYKANKTINIYLVVSFIALGAFRMGVITADSGQLTAFADRQESIRIMGTVISQPQENERGYSFYCRVDSICSNDKEYELSEKTIIFVDNERVDLLSSGQTVMVEGEISKPEGRENFGGFSYHDYLRAKGIQTVIYADKFVLSPDTTAHRNFLTVLSGIRTKLAAIISSSLTEKESGLLICLLLGDKTGLDEQTKLDFMNSGLSHALAVSGLHVGVLAGFLYKVKDRFRTNRIFSSTIVALIVMVYCIMVNTVSAMRAGIMFALLILARTSYRHYDSITSLFAAALVILLIWPGVILEVGFQLSFGATLGLASLYPCLGEKLKADNSYLKQSIAITSAATLGTLPIISYHFYQVPLISIFANLIVVPLVGLTVILGWGAAIIGLVIPAFSQCAFFIVKPFLGGMQVLTSFFASYPLILYLPRLPLWLIFVYYLFLIYPRILSWGMNYLKRNTRTVIIYFIILFLLAAGWGYNNANKKLTATFLSIGNGDCCYLTLPGGKNMLVDAGAEAKFINGQAKQNSEVLITYLKQRGIREIDYVIFSHPHLDHYGSLPELTANFKLGHIFVSADPDWNEILKGAKSKVHLVGQGTSVKLTDKTRGYFLYPADKLVTNTGSDSNNNSLVFRLDYGDFRLLFPGDIESEAERLLPAKELQSTILKVPHHGSATSTSAFLVENASPEYAVISSDERHSDLSVEKRLRDSGALVLATYKNGAVRFITDGKKVKIASLKGNKN